jgi:predicted metalloprotease with PDZ domain
MDGGFGPRFSMHKRSAFYSLALHVVLAYFLVPPIVERHQELEPPPPPASPPGHLETRLIGEAEAPSDAPCPGKWYRGVGLRGAWFNYIVREVAPGGPAAKAGIQVDDEILNPDILGADRYVTGHVINLRVQRAGVIFEVPVTIGRVCAEEP